MKGWCWGLKIQNRSSEAIIGRKDKAMNKNGQEDKQWSTKYYTEIKIPVITNLPYLSPYTSRCLETLTFDVGMGIRT